MILVAVSLLLVGRPSAPPSYVCHFTEESIRIDGSIDEESWQNAPWTQLFGDIVDGSPAPLATRAAMRWDQSNLYIAVQLEEPHLVATLTERDSVIYDDNDFEIFIDPDGDHHNYVEIEINALNTVWDLLLKKPYRDGGPALSSLALEGLQTGVRLDGTLNIPSDQDRGWSIEIAIPWSSLAPYAPTVPPREDEVWRLNFSRVKWDYTEKAGRYQKVPGRPEHNWVWAPQGAIDMHRPERWGSLHFSRKKPGTVAPAVAPDWEIRSTLVEVYYLQRKFRDRTRRWAASLEELGATDSIFAKVQISLTAEGYEASIEIVDPSGQQQRWIIRHDSHFSSEVTVGG